MNRSKWTTAVYAPTGTTAFEEEGEVVADLGRRRPDMPFRSNRPGTWTAAKVELGNETVTCVAIYGLIEEASDASMHTAISEVSALLADPNHNELLLLGGDFNVSTALAGNASGQSRLVLERLEAYGLVDCLKTMRPPGPLKECPCSGDPCLHSLTRLYPEAGGGPEALEERVAPQVDYLFASHALSKRLGAIDVIKPAEWEPHSDHAPIVAVFDI